MTIKEELDNIQAELECVIPTEANACIQYATNMAVYMARSGYMLAKAKKAVRAKKTSEISNTIISIAKESCLSAKVQNALLDSIAEEEMYIVDWCERVNKSCTHAIELCRSIISKEKAEMQYLHLPNNN